MSPTNESSEPSASPPPAQGNEQAHGSPFAVVAWGVGIFAATRLVGGFLQTTAMAAAVAQAVIAEWGTGRVGVAWTDAASLGAVVGDADGIEGRKAAGRKRADASTRPLAPRIAVGALLGIGAAALVITFLVTSHAVVLERDGAALSTLAVALVSSGLYAMRDELLLRGITLRALSSFDGAVPKIVACGVVAAAATLGERGLSLENTMLELILGLAFGALWVRDRGAWSAWSAHTAWLFTTGICLQGGLFRAQVGASRWAGGASGALGGSAAVVAVLPLATLALTWAALATRRAPRVS